VDYKFLASLPLYGWMCTSIKDEYADAAAAQGANYRGACITYAKTILLLTALQSFV
jgi:hypothetical protein